VRVAPVGDDSVVLTGTRIGLGSATDAAGRGQVVLVRVPTESHALRPGTAVLAWFATPGDMQSGVTVPRPAVVRLQGRPWVYAQVQDEQFVRRELADAAPTEAGWFTAHGLRAGDRVVVAGAEVLLSEEQKQQIEREETASE
jgi:hypothetical protein